MPWVWASSGPKLSKQKITKLIVHYESGGTWYLSPGAFYLVHIIRPGVYALDGDVSLPAPVPNGVYIFVQNGVQLSPLGDR